MRESTIIKYASAINDLKASGMAIHKREFASVSRQMFGNFIALHYFHKLGLMEPVGDKYKIISHVGTDVIIKKYAEMQHKAGIKAMKKDRERKKLIKENLSLKPEKPLLKFETRAKELSSFSIPDLVNELRTRGCQVTCIEHKEY